MLSLKILWLFLIILQFEKISSEVTENHQMRLLNQFHSANSTEKQHVNISIQNITIAITADKKSLQRKKTDTTNSFIGENSTQKITQTFPTLFTTENPLMKSIMHDGIIIEKREDGKGTTSKEYSTTSPFSERSINTTQTIPKELLSTTVTVGQQGNLFDDDVATEITIFSSGNNTDEILESVEDIFGKDDDYEYMRSIKNKSLDEKFNYDSYGYEGMTTEISVNFETTTNAKSETTTQNLGASTKSTFQTMPFDYYDSLMVSSEEETSPETVVISTEIDDTEISNKTDSVNVSVRNQSEIALSNENSTTEFFMAEENNNTTTQNVNQTDLTQIKVEVKSKDYDPEMVKVLYPAFDGNVYDDILLEKDYVLKPEATTFLPKEEEKEVASLESLDYMNEYLANDDDVANATSTVSSNSDSLTTESSILDYKLVENATTPLYNENFYEDSASTKVVDNGNLVHVTNYPIVDSTINTTTNKSILDRTEEENATILISNENFHKHATTTPNFIDNSKNMSDLHDIHYPIVDKINSTTISYLPTDFVSTPDITRTDSNKEDNEENNLKNSTTAIVLSQDTETKEDEAHTLYQINKNFTTKIVAKSLYSSQIAMALPNFQRNVCLAQHCISVNLTAEIFIDNTSEYVQENASLSGFMDMDSFHFVLNITWITGNLENVTIQFLITDDPISAFIKDIYFFFNEGTSTNIMKKENVRLALSKKDDGKFEAIDFNENIRLRLIKYNFVINTKRDLNKTADASRAPEDVYVYKCYMGEIIGGCITLSAVIIVTYFVLKKVIRSHRNDFKPSEA